MVVEYLGWDDYHFGHFSVRWFLPGRGELGRIGWVAVQNGVTSKSMSTQPSYATTRVTLYLLLLLSKEASSPPLEVQLN